MMSRDEIVGQLRMGLSASKEADDQLMQWAADLIEKASPAPDATMLEKVARIIDPEAYHQEKGSIRQARAERKATAILAALAQPQPIAGEDAS